MSAGDALPFSSCLEAQARSFKSFKAARKNETVPSKCIVEHVVPLIRIHIRENAASQKTTPFRVLSVGSGEGESDLALLGALKEFLVGKKLFYRAVEPDQIAMSEFRAKSKALTGSWTRSCLEGTMFEWFPITFQRCAEQKTKDDVKFDVVHFINSIYYLEVEATLEHCYEKELDDKGIIICIANTEDGVLAGYKAKFADHGMILDHRFYNNNEDITDLAKRNGWKYLECPGQTEILDITDIFDSSNEEGSILLDAISNWVNIRSTASDTTLEKVLKFWNEESYVNDHGKNIVELKVRAVIILKE